MRYEFGGGAYTWRGLFSEFYSILSREKVAIINNNYDQQEKNALNEEFCVDIGFFKSYRGWTALPFKSISKDVKTSLNDNTSTLLCRVKFSKFQDIID